MRSDMQVTKYCSHVENTLIPVPSPEAIPADTGFNVHLSNFDRPFDLLLQLISRHKLDITEVSLSLVTDEFISFIRKLEETGEGWRLDQATITRQQVLNQARANLLLLQEVGGLPAYVIDATRLPS